MAMTGCGVFGSNSVECALASFRTLRANSIVAICMPRQRPRYGILFSRAYCAARIFPSMPRSPNPPGTRMPPRPFNIFSAPSFSISSASTCTISTPQSLADAAVDDRLVDRFVGVLQLDVFADDADAHAMLRRDEFADDFLPVRHVRRRACRDASSRQTRSSTRSRWSISGTS